MPLAISGAVRYTVRAARGGITVRKFDNFVSNLAVLQTAGAENLQNDFIVSGIIDKFYVQFELGWKVLKELLQYEGRAEARTGSPREILKAAFTVYDFIDESLWLSMLRERNNTAHIYDAEAALELVRHILRDYIPAFARMRDEISVRYSGALSEL